MYEATKYWVSVLSLTCLSCSVPGVDDPQWNANSEAGVAELSDKEFRRRCRICRGGRIVNPNFTYSGRDENGEFTVSCAQVQEWVDDLYEDEPWCGLNRAAFRTNGCLCDPPLAPPSAPGTLEPGELCSGYPGGLPDENRYRMVTLPGGQSVSCAFLQSGMRRGVMLEHRSLAAPMCCASGGEPGEGGGSGEGPDDGDGSGEGGSGDGSGQACGASLVWQFHNGQVSEWRFEDGRPQGAATISDPAAATARLIGAGDMDGDGTEDIVWWDTASGQVSYWAMRDGARAHGTDIAILPADQTWTLKAVGDVDGDGTDDLIWWHSSGLVHYWRMVDGRWEGSGNIGRIPQSSGWDLEATGDVDADGVDELIWVKDGRHLHFWHLENGAYQGSSSIASHPVGSWELEASADLDRDGTDDLVWRDSGNGALLVSWVIESRIRSQNEIGKAPNGWQVRGAGCLHASN